jgi:hypothetical protein
MNDNSKPKNELEQQVINVLNKIEALGENESMEVTEIINVLERCRDFIDFCKFEFGEDITE